MAFTSAGIPGPGRSVVLSHRLSFGVGWQGGTDDVEVVTRIVTR